MSCIFQPIEFAGENPCVVLYAPSGEVMTAISYWRSEFSPSGTGHALFALLQNESGELEPHAYAERPGLASFLATFNKHFKGFEQGQLEATVAQPAEFSVSRADDSVEMHCMSSDLEIQVTWTGLGVPFVTRTNALDFGGEVGRSYEISSVIRTARDGVVFVNGKKQPGTVASEYGSLPRSAFLAFCETWTRLEQQ